MDRQAAKQRIHDAGLRATAPRMAVLRLLARSSRPLSYSEVMGELGCDDWDQVTLYRNLLKLAEYDLARVASRVDGVTRYEYRGKDDGPHAHPHFTCRTCGLVVCLPEATLAGEVAVSWQQSVADAELQLLGECPSCRNLEGLAKARKSKRRAGGSRQRGLPTGQRPHTREHG